MTNSILEQRTDEERTLILNCNNCGKGLSLPKNFYSLEDNREYNGFYKSECGLPYCNKQRCFDAFTDS